MPYADHKPWTPPNGIAKLVEQWAKGDNRPENGSFAKMMYEHGSVYPKFM